MEGGRKRKKESKQTRKEGTFKETKKDRKERKKEINTDRRTLGIKRRRKQ